MVVRSRGTLGCNRLGETGSCVDRGTLMPRNIMSRRHFRRHALTGKPGGSTSLDLYFAAAGDTPTRPVWIRLSASPEPNYLRPRVPCKTPTIIPLEAGR